MIDRLKTLLGGSGQARDGRAADPPGMITRTCRACGKTFTLPEEVQHWPTYCQACRAKVQPVETITRVCRGCGQRFAFPSSTPHWPKYCPACRAKRG